MLAQKTTQHLLKLVLSKHRDAWVIKVTIIRTDEVRLLLHLVFVRELLPLFYDSCHNHIICNDKHMEPLVLFWLHELMFTNVPC